MTYEESLSTVEAGGHRLSEGAAGIGGIRISPHLYNEKAEIETLMEEMEKIRRRLNKN